jgi:outer membrane protein
MKKLVKLGLIAIALMLVIPSFSQQNVKLGYIDSNRLLELMPERDSIQKALQDYGLSLENQLQAMYQEYQTKLGDYQSNVATMSSIIKQTKERELADMETRIQEFQQQADVDLQNKQMELLEPLLDKAKNAIKEVSEEQGYTYIFDVGVGTLLYYEKGDNILPLVREKLGL